MVMREGHIRQIGSCEAVTGHPTDDYVNDLKAAGYWMRGD